MGAVQKAGQVSIPGLVERNPCCPRKWRVASSVPSPDGLLYCIAICFSTVGFLSVCDKTEARSHPTDMIAWFLVCLVCREVTNCRAKRWNPAAGDWTASRTNVLVQAGSRIVESASCDGEDGWTGHGIARDRGEESRERIAGHGMHAGTGRRYGEQALCACWGRGPLIVCLQRGVSSDATGSFPTGVSLGMSPIG